MWSGRDTRRLMNEGGRRVDVIRQLTEATRTGSFTLGVCPVLDDGMGAHAASVIARAAAARTSDQRILLIETTRKTSVLSGEFGVARSAAGLQEMLLPPPLNRFDTIHRTTIPNLFLLPSGGFRKAKVACNLDQVEWIHRMLIAHFPGIVMELPAMGELLGRPSTFTHHLPDSVVLVAGFGSVGYRAVRRATSRLKTADANLAGSLLM